MKHEELKELLGAEAAGALREDERRPLAAHLASCEECRRELHELREAAALLAYAAAPIAPPAHLRTRILESARASKPAVSPLVSHTAADGGIVSGQEGTTAERAAPGALSTRGRGAADEARRLLRQLGLWDIFRARPSLGYSFAGALLLALALGSAALLLWGTNRSLRGEVARLTERLTDSEGETARGREMLAQMREVNEMLTAPESRVEQLTGTKVAPQAAARLAYHGETRHALLVASGLPPVPAGKAYQLWFISGGKPVPGGVFKIGADGRALFNDTAPAGIGEISAFAVTLEEEGGVPAPKGEIYLSTPAS